MGGPADPNGQGSQPDPTPASPALPCHAPPTPESLTRWTVSRIEPQAVGYRPTPSETRSGRRPKIDTSKAAR